MADESVETAAADDDQQTDEHGLGKAAVRDVPTDKLNDDTTFMFRAELRTGPLKKSMEANGLIVPVIVRSWGRTRPKYQLISGFRRVAAAKELGWETIPALVYRDLDDDAAYRASVLENARRKTYSDIDRAHVLKRWQDGGRTREDAADLLGLTRRQATNIYSLLELPEPLQKLLDAGEAYFKTTHALVLLQMARRYGREEIDFLGYAQLVNSEKLSVAQLKRRLKKDLEADAPEKKLTLLNEDATDFEKGEVRLSPVKFKVSELSDAERARLRGELRQLLDLLQ